MGRRAASSYGAFTGEKCGDGGYYTGWRRGATVDFRVIRQTGRTGRTKAADKSGGQKRADRRTGGRAPRWRSPSPSHGEGDRG